MANFACFVSKSFAFSIFPRFYFILRRRGQTENIDFREMQAEIFLNIIDTTAVAGYVTSTHIFTFLHTHTLHANPNKFCYSNWQCEPKRRLMFTCFWRRCQNTFFFSSLVSVCHHNRRFRFCVAIVARLDSQSSLLAFIAAALLPMSNVVRWTMIM